MKIGSFYCHFCGITIRLLDYYNYFYHCCKKCLPAAELAWRQRQ